MMARMRGSISLPGSLSNRAMYAVCVFTLIALGGCAPADVPAPPTPTLALVQTPGTPTEVPVPVTPEISPSPQVPTPAPSPTPAVTFRLGQVDKITVRVNDQFLVEAPAGQWHLAYNPALVTLRTRDRPDANRWQFLALAPGLTPITAEMESPPCEGEFCPPAPVVQFTTLIEIIAP